VSLILQDIALIGELTIKDCAMYFGRIYGMAQEEIEKKYEHLRNLLDLPTEDKYVNTLRYAPIYHLSRDSACQEVNVPEKSS